MKTFQVRIPITGYIAVEVTAEDEVQAKELAFATEATLDDVEEWELHEQVCTGNVLHAVLNEISVEEV